MILSFEGHTPEIGEGTYISPTATVVGNVKIGRSCYIGHGAVVRGDYSRIEIGDFTSVEEGVVVHAPPDTVAQIGEHVTIGHNAVAHSRFIDDWAVIGMCSVASIGSRIGRWAVIAEGAVVKQRAEIPDDTVAAGTPAVPIRPVSDKEKELWTGVKELYNGLAGRYLTGSEVIGQHPLRIDHLKEEMP